MGQRPDGFAWTRVGSDVVITHHGRRATVLRGQAVTDFEVDVADGDPQLLMAKITGNYRHGNERTARNHPRNR